MRSKSKSTSNEKQMNLFGWADEPSYKPVSSTSREELDYGEWRCIAANHMWDYWFVTMEDAINVLEVVDEDALRVAYNEGTAPKAFVNDLAYAYDWVDFGHGRTHRNLLSGTRADA